MASVGFATLLVVGGSRSTQPPAAATGLRVSAAGLLPVAAAEAQRELRGSVRGVQLFARLFAPAAVGALAARRRLGRRGSAGSAAPARRAQSGEAEALRGDDLYVRAMCTAVKFVGKRGAVLGVEQMSKEDGDYHFPDLPIAIPVLLGSQEADDFRACRRDLEWTEMALCEVRIHAPKGGGVEAELFLTEGCQLPASSDGFLLVDAVKEGERVVKAPVGEALAMALKLKAPVLLSARYLLHAAKGAMEQMRDEQVCAGDEGCDVELQDLIESLGGEDPSRERMGDVLETIKPFAWYWAEHRQGGEQESATLAEFMERYKKEFANVYAATW